MRLQSLVTTGVAALVLLAVALPARGEAYKVSLSFSFADDNVLRDAGETRINSPSAYFGQSPEAYFDRMGDGGFSSSKLYLYVYGAAEGLHPRFLPEGAMVLRLNPAEGDYQDDGTYLRLNYFLSDDRKRSISLDMFPIDSDRMRLGFHYDISWGGSDIFPKHFRKGLVPGMKLQADLGWMYAFLGAKTALVRSPTEDILDNPGGNTNKIVERTAYGVLGGLGFELYDGLWLEANGGYFQKGSNTRQNVLGEPIHAAGVSAQLSYHEGLSIGRRIDMRLYVEDPLRHDILAPETYGSGISWNVAAEWTSLVQTLEDPDRVSSTVNEWSHAAFLSAQMKVDRFRIHLEGSYRTLTYITYNVPGFVPYQALPAGVTVSPELFGALSVDYNWAAPNLTFAITAGILRPATYEGVTPAGPSAPSNLQGVRKTVVRGAASGDWDILPPGEDEVPVLLLKASVKWSFGDTFAALAEVTYGRDANLAQVFRDFRGHAIRSFDDPNILGFGLLARMSF